tara:strand:- start:677 stop:1057 length:381 start_codon:yes stop_codon:yes gene_type:complete
MKTFKQHLEEDLASVQKVNKKKEASMKKINKEKENTARKIDTEKEKIKRDSDTDKKQTEAEKKRDSNKRESIVQRVSEYITTDGARKKCDGGDNRRTENHDCDKVHSDMTHKEWEASQDTPKDESI